MSEKIEVPGYKVPDGMDCPICGSSIQVTAPVAGQPRGFKKGLIVVCAHCSAVLRVGDTSFQPMTEQQIKELHPESQRALAIAVGGTKRLRADGKVEGVEE